MVEYPIFIGCLLFSFLYEQKKLSLKKKTMCKFTTIILLFCFISVISDTITAQNTDYKILKSLNESSDGLRNYSAFISNSTKISSVAIPVVMGSVALFQKNDALLPGCNLYRCFYGSKYSAYLRIEIQC